MNNNNRLIDDKGLSESTSLTHLLSDDDSSDTIAINIIKHSPYYSESDFHKSTIQDRQFEHFEFKLSKH